MLDLKPKYTVDRIDKETHYYSVNKSPTYYDGVTTIIGLAYAKHWHTKWALKLCQEAIVEFLSEHATKRLLTQLEIETICKEATLKADLVRDKAAEDGTICHAIIDQIINTGLPQQAVPKEIEPKIRQFMEWKVQFPFDIVQGDTKVASRQLEYGGSLDFVARSHDGKIIIIDAKFGKAIRQESAYQVAAYCRAFQEMYGLNYLPEGRLVRFGSRSYTEKKIADMTRSLHGFYNCLGLYRDFKREQYEDSFMKPLIEKENVPHEATEERDPV